MSSEDTRAQSERRVHGAAIEAAQRTRNDNNTEEHTEVIDYKMVTFSLGGKDYGIDIMNVKEIAKFHHFTYVPNTPQFVRGVYNLRGEIISIIDLRLMFNLPAPQKEDNEPEEGLIVRLEDKMLGVVVDNVDRVVGISSENIQPPHPIFSDINLKYISGIVEHDTRLYIILDVERIFAPDDRQEVTEAPQTHISEQRQPPEMPDQSHAPATQADESTDETALGFVRETLSTFAGFHATELNDEWVTSRFTEWKAERGKKGQDPQLNSFEEAQEFLAPFYSSSTATFWSEEYIRRFSSILPTQNQPSSFNVWNVGGGSGYETYSLAVTVRKALPQARIKIWANDNDLLAISSAPNLVFQAESVPESFEPYIVAGKNGFSFEQSIRDIIVFEFHDILNQNAIPEVDLIVARDVLSFLEPAQQRTALSHFAEKARVGTLLVLGENELLPSGEMWEPVSEGPNGTYRKIE